MNDFLQSKNKLGKLDLSHKRLVIVLELLQKNLPNH